MLTFEMFKKALGKHAENMTDEEIADMKRREEGLAKIILDEWIREQQHEKRTGIKCVVDDKPLG